VSESTFEVPEAPSVDLPSLQPVSAALLEEPAREFILSVIVPARNEEDCIRECLASLVAQSESFFELGHEWEILMVNDASTDRTRAIAEEFAEVTILEAPKLEKGWTGKPNACWAGSQAARGDWLLFTDADTVHEPGNLRRAIFEAEKAKVGMLSYSPRQIVSGFWQSALMPLVFSELALAYPPEKVSNPESRLAAANGQFLLVSRAAYRAVGGHTAVSDSILEDLDLAYLAKRRKVGLRFRYAPEAVATRMYRSFGQMYEGWTKGLAILFNNCLATAAWKLLDLGLLVGLPLLAMAFWHQLIPRLGLLLLWVRTLWRFYARVAKSNFSVLDCTISVFALPLFAFLLWRSWFHHTVLKRVAWKGREYPA